jgi:hypothetical protein
MRTRNAPAQVKPQARSQITNGTKTFEHAPTRIRSERRYRDLVCIFAAEFSITSDADLSAVETAASLKLALETQTAALVRGDRADDGELVRLSSELRAVLTDLKRTRTASAGAGPEQDDEEDD